MNAELHGKVGIVTGAAGSIGRASAEALLDAGASLVLTDHDADRLRAMEASLPAQRVASLAGDAAEESHVRQVVELAGKRFGALDLAFANAGVFGVVAAVPEYPVDTFDEVMRVNVRGPFLLCRYALPAMRDGGCLVITSSVVGLTSDPGICAYATSKHALVGLMRTAAKESGPRGIRVNTIHPGPTDNAFQHAIEMSATGLSEHDASAAFEQQIPLRRHATPAEIAATVRWLMGPGGGFTTGATIAVDGGMSI